MLLICAIIKAIKIAAGIAKKIGVIKHILGLYNEHQHDWSCAILANRVGEEQFHLAAL